MKKLAIGCGIALVLLAILIVALVMMAPKAVEMARGAWEKEVKAASDNARFEATWKPPAPELGAPWFPEEVAGWRRAEAAPIKEVPELRSPKKEITDTPGVVDTPLAKDGYRAAYSLGGKGIDVIVLPATDLEMEGMMVRVRGFTPRPENSHSGTSSFQRGHELTMKYGERERVYARPIGEWFIFMHTIDGAEIKPFADAWLHAIDTQTAAPSPEAPK